MFALRLDGHLDLPNLMFISEEKSRSDRLPLNSYLLQGMAISR